MNHSLKKGWRLIRQKQYAEAEAFFNKAASDPYQRAEALSGLAEIAQARRNYDLKLEYLDELAVLAPDDLNARLMRVHLRGLKGHIGPYEEEVDKIMRELKHAPLQPKPVYRKLLRGIQFLFSGSEKVRYLLELLERVSRAIEENPEQSDKLKLFRTELYLALGDMNKAIGEVAKITQQHPDLPGLKRLQKVAEKAQSPQYPDYSAPKVFGIGLSRTATSSLDKALNLLGFQSVHWLNPYTQTVIGDTDFPLFDAFSDISVSYQFERLYHTFPNARFIFTTREVSSWVKSISNHYQNSRQIISPSELLQTDKTRRFGGAVRAIEWSLYGRYDNWQKGYVEFERRVTHFFSDKPSDRFLELNICGGEGWAKLCPFLEKPIPGLPFPNENKGTLQTP